MSTICGVCVAVRGNGRQVFKKKIDMQVSLVSAELKAQRAISCPSLRPLPFAFRVRMSSLAPLLSLALLLPAGALLVSAPAARSAGAAAGQRSGSRPLMQTIEEAASAAQPVLWSPDKVADIRIEGGKTLKTFKMPARALAANGARLVLLHTSGPREGGRAGDGLASRSSNICSRCSFIEKPDPGLLTNRCVINYLPFVRAEYCVYGRPYRKRTRMLADMGDTRHPKMCDRQHLVDGRHEAAAHRCRTQTYCYNSSPRPITQDPEVLCQEIFEACIAACVVC